MKLLLLQLGALLMLFSFVLASPPPLPSQAETEIVEEQEPSTSGVFKPETPEGLPNAVHEDPSRFAKLPEVNHSDRFEKFSVSEKLVRLLKNMIPIPKSVWDRRKSDKAMARLIRNRPADVQFDHNPAGRLVDFLGWSVIQLPNDEKLASSDLAIMTGRRKSFYAVGTGNRVWLFQRGRNPEAFIYNGDLSEQNQAMVRSVFANTNGLSNELSDSSVSAAARSLH
ncbi:uncharacterized protein SPSC_05108 [Sporisorium scitamineum]|uniref:Effector family protein Eff1 n=1 Tax=Sporisorium scitamineum TaxID=49012 RepID=A0A0F7RWK9_9BASI|nr:hypothetical protein [Sporisorium scitamineum]CDU25274.1 uncharacterized protein SPSC_05108 [Sporisorium scitamineum]